MPSARLPEPSPSAAAHSVRLMSEIARQIRAAGGWIPFSRYMELALYAPALGYYVAGSAKFGSAGDFVTAPEMSPLFGRALAAQAAQVMQQSAPHILEFGAGSGALAAELIAELDRRDAPLARYWIIELSPDLKRRQQQRLANYGDRVQWLDALPDAFEGCVLANEVLDAMPIELFTKSDGQWQQRGIELDAGGGYQWSNRVPPPDIISTLKLIEADLGPLADDYQVELGIAARRWMSSVAATLKRGALLAIDYGFPRAEFYHPQRSAGTLLCHYRHHVHDDPLWLPGLNDITAHLDFTAIAEAACAANLEVLGYTTQAHFLMNCGILDLIIGASAQRDANVVQRLVSEAEMGELFKVLAVGRRIEQPLLGFARGDRTHTL